MRDAPLKTELKDGQLIISIGVDTLCHAAKVVNPDIEFTDKDAFSGQIVEILSMEDHENGQTQVTLMLDDAIEFAISNGAPGIEYEHERDDV